MKAPRRALAPTTSKRSGSPWTTLASRMAKLPRLQVDLGPLSPWGRMLRLRAQVDAILDRLIATAKADPALTERPDVLALLVQATHTDGSPMTNAESVLDSFVAKK